MIISFADKKTANLFHSHSAKDFGQIARKALMKLEIINAATDIEDLRIPPSNHLEQLKGNREGQHSIRINTQWRICFIWKDGNALAVEIVDYH